MTVGKSRQEWNASDLQLVLFPAVSTLTQLRGQPRGWCCPPSEWIFPSQLTQSRKSLTDADMKPNPDNPSLRLYSLVIPDWETKERRLDSTINRSIIHLPLSAFVYQLLRHTDPCQVNAATVC